LLLQEFQALAFCLQTPTRFGLSFCKSAAFSASSLAFFAASLAASRSSWLRSIQKKQGTNRFTLQYIGLIEGISTGPRIFDGKNHGSNHANVPTDSGNTGSTSSLRKRSACQGNLRSSRLDGDQNYIHGDKSPTNCSV
jgi:hypothetical protein